MKNLYKKGDAMFPRLATDVCFEDLKNQARYGEKMNEVFSFVMSRQLLSSALWHRFVDQYRIHSDATRGWRGEYWGKMMRGAAFVYATTRDESLYRLLEESVREMIDVAEEDGRLSTYLRESEFRGWDLWCRKYALLGMQYFLEICQDAALSERIVRSMERQLLYVMRFVGSGEGQIPITQTSNFWRGLNSSSLLEPVVRLYHMTGKREYLTFAEQIVEGGFTEISNLLELVEADDFMPYQYPITKAYEMISCFEGLLEYYRATGEEKYRAIVLRFADRLLETDVTVIGTCGCTHEQFDHSAVRQANPDNDLMQETCVTVTLMKFMYQLHLFTGESRYVDVFERAFYNAYLGALNTEDCIEPSIVEKYPDAVYEPLPFDSYSPLTAGKRGRLVGGQQLMPDGHYYGCCACIGSAGIGLYPKCQLVRRRDGLVVNLYEGGEFETHTPQESAVTLTLSTAYPVEGKVALTLSMEKAEEFTLYLRDPSWSQATLCRVNGDPCPASENGYFALTRLWQEGDRVELELDMTVRVTRPVSYGSQILMNQSVRGKNYVVPTFDRENPRQKYHVALQRGPLMLAQDSRFGDPVGVSVPLAIEEDETVLARRPATPKKCYPCLLEVQIPLTDGGTMTLTDYGSAGKKWEESTIAVWIETVH